MSSSIFSSSGGRGLLGAGIAGVLALCVIASVELQYRHAYGGPIGILPGQSMEELQWKIDAVKKRNGVIVVGDSRVGWGFSEGEFNAQMHSNGYDNWRGINAGLPGASAAALVSYLSLNSCKRGAVIVNYSPAGLYFFRDRYVNLASAKNLTLQDVLDKKIEMHLRGLVYTKFMSLSALTNLLSNWGRINYPNKAVWVNRKCFADGFVNAITKNTDGTPYDDAEMQLDQYTRVIKELNAHPAGYEKRLGQFKEALKEIQRKGLFVLLVRFPVGKRMRELELAVPRQYRIAAVAQAAGILYIDYNERAETAEMLTLDESHLTPECARSMSRILAADVVKVYLQQGQH